MSEQINSFLLPPRVVRASAGTGKTFQLSSRYLQLLLFGEQPDKILATTFTRKAAGEIRERILQRLVIGAGSEHEAKALGVQLDIPDLQAATVLGALRRFISSQHRLQISTLDSFFISLAKSFTSELHLPAGWTLLDPGQTSQFLDEAVKELCQDSKLLLDLLKLLQNNSGSRKVHEVLVTQIASLQELVYASDRSVWSCDFTVEAPHDTELQEAIRAFRHFPPPLTKAGTPNVNFQKALNKISELISGSGYWESRVLNDGGELIVRLMAEEPGSFSRVEIPEELIKISRPIIQQIRYRVLNRLNEQTIALRTLMDHLIALYEDQRNAAALVSFDDVKRLIFKSVIISNITDIFFRIDTRISHLLLDEFQDTSLAEWVLLEPIANEVLSYADGSHSFFCVGDTKQAIYGFRGGVAEIFDQLESRWSHLETARLEVSRRSAQTVLDYVNRVFQNISKNSALTRFPEAGNEWQKRFDPHSAFNQELQGYVQLTNSSEQNPVTLMADEIHKLYLLNPDVSIGVLVRYQKAVAECLYELKKRGIPASGEGGSALTDSPVVAVLLSYLWLIDHPQDTIAHYHVSSSPLAQIFGVNRNDSLAQRDLISRTFRDKLLNQNLQDVLGGLVCRLESLCNLRDRTKLQQVVDAAITFQSEESLRLSRFVEYVRKLRIPDPEQSSIKVMTIHKSKGLEFDAVFLADLDYEISRSSRSPVMVYQDTTFDPPSRVLVSVKERLRAVHPELERPYQRLQTMEALEALSVLYVALTRARYALYLYAATGNSRATVGKLLGNASESIELDKKLDKSERLETSQIVFQQGADNWYQSVAINNRSHLPAEFISTDLQFAIAPVKGLRNIPRVTPSKTKTKIQFRGHTPEGRIARNKGTLLHKLFEMIQWSETFIFSEQDLWNELKIWTAGNHIFQETEIRQAISLFNKNIKEQEIVSLFSPAAYQHWQVPELLVEQERRFSVLTSKGLSVGTIDRLVLGRRDGQVCFAEIIDYKSDLNPTKHTQFHTEQLESYREAIAAMYQLPLSQISCKLLYLETLEIKVVS